MLGRTGICIVAIVLVLFTISCTRLSEESIAIEGEQMAKVKMAHLDSIPSKWGNLISVSSVPEYTTYVQLWFQDEDGNVRMVPYSIKRNQMISHFRLIHRK